jgi:hypothetical protein
MRCDKTVAREWSRRLRGAWRFSSFPWVSLRFTHGYRSGWRYAPNGGLTVEID